MRPRHRIPTIFNLSMVDVLCCALGCVILLWLLNLRAAKERAEAAGRTGIELAQARTDLSELRARFQEATRLAEAAAKDRDAAHAQSGADRTLRTLRTEKADTDERLARKDREAESLTQEAANQKRAAALALLVRERNARQQCCTHRRGSGGRLREAKRGPSKRNLRPI